MAMRPPRHPLHAVLVVATAFLMLLLPAMGTAASSGAASETLRTRSYVGPRAELAGATIVLRDRDGAVLATGRTGYHGTHRFRVRNAKGLKFPLSITTSGGRAAGKPFTGTLEARVFGVGLDYAVVQNSLVSTAASHIAGSETRRGYARAVNRVRRSLGIRRGSLPEVLRLRNGDVGYRQLMRASSRAGGFDALAAYVAERAARGKRVGGLRPKSAMHSAAPGQVSARRVKSANQASTSPNTAICDLGVPSDSTSSEVITDVGAIGINGLMLYAGIPDVASSSITGMLLAPIGEDADASVQQGNAAAVNGALTCLSEQLNYLSGQIAAVQLSVDVSAATGCSNTIAGPYGYQAYDDLVAAAAPAPPTDSTTPAAPPIPISAANTELPTYLPTWGGLAANPCGSAINDMLWGTSGMQAGAWQQLNKNTQAGVQWYTQAQVQDLQTFLSYWGTQLYWQFILLNEYYNYGGIPSLGGQGPGHGLFAVAQNAAGATTNSSGAPVCTAGSANNTPTFCVWQNNIASAYPPDLYSDEIAIISSGLAVNASPGGLVAPQPITPSAANVAYADTNKLANQSYSPTAMNLGWWYNYFLNYTSGITQTYDTNTLKFLSTGGQPFCVKDNVGWCPPGVELPNWSQLSVNAFNAQGVNPNSYGSAIQTYWNPQAVGRSMVTSSQLGALSTAGPGGQSAATVFYNAINQTPSSSSSPAPTAAWGSITADEATYWAADNSSSSAIAINLDWIDRQWYFNFSLAGPVGAQLNNKTFVYDDIGDLQTTPMIGLLSGRSWWPTSSWPTSGSAGASTYVPPPPPTP